MSTSWLSAEVLNHDPDMRKQSCDLCISRFSTPVQESVSSVQRAKEHVLKETQIHQLWGPSNWGPSNLQPMWQCNEPSFHLNRCLSIVKLSWDNQKPFKSFLSCFALCNRQNKLSWTSRHISSWLVCNDLLAHSQIQLAFSDNVHSVPPSFPPNCNATTWGKQCREEIVQMSQVIAGCDGFHTFEMNLE